MSPYSASAASFHGSAARMARSMGVSTLGAVTPTDRYGSAAPTAAAKRRRPRSAGDREGGVEAGDLEDLAGRRLEPTQLDPTSALASPLQRPDEDPQAGRVDEVHAREVDDDPTGAILDEPVQLVAEGRRGGDVHLSLDDDDGDVGVFAHRDAEVFTRVLIRAGGDHGGQTTRALGLSSQLEPDRGAARARVVAPARGDGVDDLSPRPSTRSVSSGRNSGSPPPTSRTSIRTHPSSRRTETRVSVPAWR